MGGVRSLVRINYYVLVLLQYCLWWYVVMVVGRWLRWSLRITDIALVVGVVGSSLVMYFCFDKQGWCWERWGLAYGLLLFRFYPRVIRYLGNKRSLKTIAFGLLSLVAGMAYLKYKFVYIYGEYLLKIALGIFILTLLFLCSHDRRWGNRLVSFLGGISYEVYLSHGLIMRVLNNHTQLSSGLFIWATVACTLVFSWLVHDYVSKPLVKRWRVCA